VQLIISVRASCHVATNTWELLQLLMDFQHSVTIYFLGEKMQVMHAAAMEEWIELLLAS